jgi:GNAT superfamily N-acetyltransferase
VTNAGDPRNSTTSPSNAFVASEWERILSFGDRKILIRPIRSDDAPLIVAFLHKVTAADLRLRFFASIKEFTPDFINHLTRLDFNRAMAFVALDENNSDVLGVVRLHLESNSKAGEYAILVRSDLKGHGLGWILMTQLIEYARKIKLPKIIGEVLGENTTMLMMCKEFGFSISENPQDATVKIVSLDLAR